MSKHNRVITPYTDGLSSQTINEASAKYKLQDHLEVLPYIFSSNGLKPYYDKFMEIMQHYPTYCYHGLLHSQITALHAYEGALWSKLIYKETRSILVAALYHDFLHTRKSYDDSENIKIAIAELTKVHDQLGEHERLKEDEFDEVKRLIRCTQYPYAKSGTNKLDILVRILRDADAMTTYHANRKERLELMIGLFNEMNNISRQRFGYSDVSHASLLKKQRDFTFGIEWNTVWSKSKAITLNWPLIQREVNYDLEHCIQQACDGSFVVRDRIIF